MENQSLRICYLYWQVLIGFCLLNSFLPFFMPSIDLSFNVLSYSSKVVEDFVFYSSSNNFQRVVQSFASHLDLQDQHNSFPCYV